MCLRAHPHKKNTLAINACNWIRSNRFQFSELAGVTVWHSAASNNKMIPVHIKTHRSTLPFDHVRIVQIDLHEVLLFSMVTIERPARQRRQTDVQNIIPPTSPFAHHVPNC